jgi:hypothetical protein
LLTPFVLEDAQSNDVVFDLLKRDDRLRSQRRFARVDSGMASGVEHGLREDWTNRPERARPDAIGLKRLGVASGTALGYKQVNIAGHDIGAMVAYSFAAN